MSIFHNYKCIFIHLSRTGGTTIHNALGEDYIGPRIHHSADYYKTMPEYAAVWDSYLKFATVRNPFDRLVSLYNQPAKHHNYFNAYRSQSKRPVKSLPVNTVPERTANGNVIVTKRSFEDYARYPTFFRHEPPYITQSQAIGEDIDFLIKFENLQEGFNKLCDKIGRPRSVLDVVGPTPNRKKDYKKYYTPSLIQSVSEVFREDLTRFHYSFFNNSLWYTLANKYNYYNE